MQAQIDCPNEHTDQNRRTAQADRILEMLRTAGGQWVALPDILALQISQYGARILELRRAGHVIENRTERIAGMRHSWYRLVSSDSPVSTDPASLNEVRRA